MIRAAGTARAARWPPRSRPTIFPDPTAAVHVLAIVGAAADGGAGPAADAVYESTDGGDTFAATPLYVAPAGAELLGVEIARSDPRIIYLSMATPEPHRRIARSDDAGARWTTFDVEPSIGARTARIVAVDPVDANVIYLRVTGQGAELLAVSRDGGMTLHDTDHAGGRNAQRVRAPRERHGAGRRPRARRGRHDRGCGVALGRRRRDVRRLDADADATPARARRACRRLYLAGSNYIDGWALAVSSDDGRDAAADRCATTR